MTDPTTHDPGRRRRTVRAVVAGAVLAVALLVAPVAAAAAPAAEFGTSDYDCCNN